MSSPAYRRVIVKISGEALSANGVGIDQATVDRIADDLVACRQARRPARRRGGRRQHFPRRRSVDARRAAPGRRCDGHAGDRDECLVLEAAIERKGREARTMSAIAMPPVCENYSRKRAIKNLDKGRIVLLAGGTGNPFFTTDTTAVLRAAEIGAEAVLKATNVDGVYSADPKKDPKAKRYDRLTHQEALEKDLQVMDATAFALARENRMPIIVFSIHEKGAIEQVLRGKGRATRRRLMSVRFRYGQLLRSIAMAAATHDINELKRRMQGALGALKTGTVGACAPAAHRRTCSTRSRSMPMARRCRSIRSRPLACRSRA